MVSIDRLLRTRRRRPQGLADLLPYDTFVRPNVLLLKDGSFLAVYGFRGPDVDALLPEQIYAYADYISRALRLGDHFMLHVDAIRRPHEAYPDSRFPHPTLALIDGERRARFAAGAAFDTAYFLAVTHHPNAAGDQLFASLFSTPSDSPQLEEALSLFETRLQEIEDTATILNLERLAAGTLLSYLLECITHRRQPVVDRPFVYLDQLLATDPLLGGTEPRIGDVFIAPITLTGLPASTEPALLQALAALPFDLRWSTRFITLDRHTATKLLQKLRLQWSQARTPLLAYILSAFRNEKEGQEGRSARNPHAEAMTADADAALNEARSGDQAYGFWTTIVLLFDASRDALATKVRETRKALAAIGVPARLETFNALDAYLGTLPGVGTRNLRKSLVTTANFSHIGPFTASYTGSPRCPSPLIGTDQPALVYARSTTGDPFRLNLHASDVGHFLLLGPTGMGKTTALALITSQWFRYPAARVFAFDRGYGLQPLVEASGGTHYDLGSQGVHFCPLASLSAQDYGWAASLLETLFTLNGVAMTPDHRDALGAALQLLARAPANGRTLEHLRIQLQHAELRQALVPYTGTGPYADLLDSATDTLDSASTFHVFELGTLLGYGPNVVVPVLLTIFHKIESLLDGSPTLILLEEAWELLGRSLFADQIAAWLKTLRKRNAAVGFVTQSLGDLDRSPIAHVLYESAPTRILLANPEAATPNGAGYYQRMGLNDAQIRLIAKAQPKRHYFVQSPSGSRLIELDLGPVQLSFFGAGDPESLARIRHLSATHGRLWPAVWLRERGLTAASDALFQQLKEAS